jgi:hypothetical protein
MSLPAEAISGDRPVGPLFPEVPPLAADGVLLHVGVHKTGTTAIQAALADARPELRQRGTLYPGKRKAQHRSALAVTQRTWGWKERGGESYDMTVYDWLVDQTRGHAGRVAISSEFFCECDAETAAKVVEDLGRERVHVVITLRNLGRLLPSSWQQYLKYGLVAGYEKWLHNIFDAPEGKMTPSFWRRNNHAAVVSRWADAVGPENVTVLVLEDVDLSAMYRTFAQLLDAPEDLLVSRMNLTSNRSMTAAEAEFLIGLNKRVKSDLTWDEYVKYVRRGVALGMVEGREPSPDEPRLHTPEWALEAAAKHGERAVEGIRASGVRVLGDLDALGTQVGSPPPAPESVTRQLPTEAAVQAVVTVIEATRGNPELSVKQLRSELWARTKEDAKLRWRLRSLRP